MMNGYTTVLLWVCCIAALSYLNVDEITPRLYRRELQNEGIIDPLIQRVVISEDGVCLNKRKHASIHDERPDVKEDYVKWYGGHYNWDYYDVTLPQVKQLQNPNLVVWETYGANTSTSLWVPNSNDFAKGLGWYTPPDPTISPTRTLVGKFGFFTTWFTGHYGHFNHDYLPSLAYIRKVAMSRYGDDTRFILVDYHRNKELVKFMDPAFYELVDWISIEEVVKIEGEVTYIEPVGMPEMAGHALMAYLRQWMIETHPFNQADFDANKHVLYYDRVGSSGVMHGRVLDADHQKQILEAIRAAMDRHGLGDQELVIFNGQKGNGEPMSPDDQFQAFRRASTLIGPHGTGLSNMVWTNPNPKTCETRTQLLEFVVGADVAQVQCIYGGYYRQFRSLPLDYHEIFYQIPSTSETTYINIAELDNALNVMWGGDKKVHIEAARN